MEEHWRFDLGYQKSPYDILFLLHSEYLTYTSQRQNILVLQCQLFFSEGVREKDILPTFRSGWSFDSLLNIKNLYVYLWILKNGFSKAWLMSSTKNRTESLTWIRFWNSRQHEVSLRCVLSAVLHCTFSCFCVINIQYSYVSNDSLNWQDDED